MTKPLTLAAIGEPMIELARSLSGPLTYDRRIGGDTLNTSVYLARLLRPETARVQYVTRLGDDPLSDWMIESFANEGIDCRHIARVPGRRPGLYIIDTDDKGERSFSYWRGEAPVRQLFEEPELAEGLAASDAVFTSGITLAVLGAAGRRRLIELLRRVSSAGRPAVFDTNYRPLLWTDRTEAATWMREAIAAASHVLPSSDDLEAIFAKTQSAEDWVGEIAALGPREVVVKTGGGPVHTQLGSIMLDRISQPRDTTGAGDSFNAGYLAARLSGASVQDSVRKAHLLASRVIQYPGAVIAREAMVDLMP
ncbi:sugar kinase [Nordella sp. HKS 07]|uniref:sugar kinase n=1 Tax=Nordella sp. HKS 07 TaxID=2712222 RepID=UPI0013E12FD5|nr:sugar kinase [Nordella sp. HKS 07]QIG48571.1 sugar kinase [Nordella sp. HKS 07]